MAAFYDYNLYSTAHPMPYDPTSTVVAVYFPPCRLSPTPFGFMPDWRPAHADKSGHVPPRVGELDYPQKIGKPISTVRRVSVRHCPRARTRRFKL